MPNLRIENQGNECKGKWEVGLRNQMEEFPGDPAVRTMRSHC